MFQRVLIVDDALPIHDLIKAQLGGDTLQVHSAYSGESGLRIASEVWPDVILLDVDLPGIDGFEVCRRLKANATTQAMPIIFVTADFSAQDKAKAMGLGAADYVTKPFKRDELAARVAANLRSKRQLEEQAMIDSLTGLWNRQYLEQNVVTETAQRLSAGQPVSCIVMDVDGMEGINRRHGVLFGDRLLRAIANLLLTQCRSEDVVSHVGGGEFAIIVPGQTRAGAGRLAERLCWQVQSQLRQHAGREVGLTCSFGVADYAVAGRLPLIERGEAALKRAKESGGACVSIARPLRGGPLAA